MRMLGAAGGDGGGGGGALGWGVEVGCVVGTVCFGDYGGLGGWLRIWGVGGEGGAGVLW